MCTGKVVALVIEFKTFARVKVAAFLDKWGKVLLE